MALTILAVVLAVFCNVDAGDHPRTFSFCGNQRDGRLIHVPDKVQCIERPAPVIRSGRAKMWIPTHPLETAPAWKCHTYYRRICTYMDLLGGGGITDDVTHLESVSQHDCHMAQASMGWRGLPLHQVQSTIWSTNQTAVAEYRWMRTTCTEATNLILEGGSVATADGVVTESSLGDTSSCHFKRGWCAHSDGIIIWDPLEAKWPCPFEYKGEYKASYHDDYFAIDSINGAFTVTNAPPIANLSCLPPGGVHTAQGPYFITDQPVRPPAADDKKPTNTSAKPVSVGEKHWLDTDGIDAKLEWLVTQIHAFDAAAIAVLQHQICQTVQQHLNLVHQLLKVDPTAGIRALLANDSLVAKWVGSGVLLVWTCDEITADSIVFDHRLGDECFDYLPIRARGRVYFVLPGTNELSLKSPTIPCRSVRPTVYFDDDRRVWTTVKGPVKVYTLPLQVLAGSEWRLPVFDSSPIFHDAEEDITAQRLIGLKNAAAEAEKLRAEMDHMIEHVSTFTVDPATFVAGMKNVSKKISNFYVSGYNRLVSGTFQSILNVLLVPLLVIAFVCLGVLCYKYRTRIQKFFALGPGRFLCMPFKFLSCICKSNKNGNRNKETTVSYSAASKSVRFVPVQNQLSTVD